MDADLVGYLEGSFLSPLLELPGLTDISYNGSCLFYATNDRGRQKSEALPSRKEVSDFLRQIANLAERQFSYSCPILDVSFGRYRLNAVFSSIVRVVNEKSVSFSLRLASSKSRLEDDSAFFGGPSRALLEQALAEQSSIVIAGSTSSGKTELQKWLLLHLRDNARVVVIDNVEELDMVRDDAKIDITSWLVQERNMEGGFSSLIRNALRNNPDYLIVAESRGAEMLDVLNSVMSGHPIITTLHAKDLESVPYRMARMVMMSGQKLLYDDVLGDIYHHFSYIVYLVKIVLPDGRIQRFVESVGRLNEPIRKIDVLYRRQK